MQHISELAAHPHPAEPLRAAVLDLVSRAEAAPPIAGFYAEESGLIAALQRMVLEGRPAADRLFDRYHGDTRSRLARVFDEFGY